MFRSFNMKEVQASKAKASIEKKIRADILEDYPALETCIDEIWPKKASDDFVVTLGKTKGGGASGKVSVVLINDAVTFFKAEDLEGGGWFPTLRVLHKYPAMMPKLQVDRGAIKFVIKGADVM